MKVLIQYGENKKIKELKYASELPDAIMQLYNLESHSYFLQKYNSEFEEFVDFEENEVLSHRDKIKIMPLKRIIANAPDQVSNCDSNSLTFSSPIIENYEMLITSEDYGSELEDFIVLPPHREKWPEIINLPITKFSKNLEDCLNAGKELSWETRRELISHLANYAYSFKPYPDKAERIQICKCLVTEYPYLKTVISVAELEAKLNNKLKKIRQADTSLEVKLNRSISKVPGSKTPRKLNLNPRRGELNWAPDHLEGETIETIDMHKKFLIAESLKSEDKQNLKKISSLMSLTYSFRRELINNKISVSELRKEYPIFFQEKEQFEEFKRLTAVCIKSSFFVQIEYVGPKLYQLFLKKKKSGEELQFAKYCEEELIEMDEFTKIQAEASLGLFSLPYLLKEDVDSIFKIVGEDKGTLDDCTYPIVLISGNPKSGEFNVVIEGMHICNCKNFLTAVALVVSFFYTLSISYPSSVKNTLIFIQVCLLRIRSSTTPPKVQTLINKIYK